MSKNNFTRSNVNEQTLMVSEINRSGFDLSHRVNTTLKLGRLTPVNIERLLPTDIVQGSLSPRFQLENCGTPTIGKLRLDTHTFQVNMRRIHNSFRSFMEDNSNNNTLPSFGFLSIARRYLTYVCKIGETQSLPTSLTLADDLSDLGVPLSPAPSTMPALAGVILTNFSAGMKYLCQQTTNEFGWNKDFFALEVQRLANVSQYTPNDESALAYVLYNCLLPLFGEGSVLDMLGYPIYGRDGAWYQILSKSQPTVAIVTSMKLSEILSISSFDYVNQVYSYFPDELYSEMPLRAVYAIYYDYFRDWHVEPRDTVLNPDNFGQQPLLAILYGENTSWLINAFQLLVLRFRNFSRDFLTTVQVDDIYRHVYSPIFESSSDTNAIEDYNFPGGYWNNNALNENKTAQGASIVNALRGLTQDIPFLSDMFYSLNSSDSFYDFEHSNAQVFGFFADLQTMRRSGMLEKWLARNYFFPDTYVGQLRAHYDVVPEDINYINCQYLGGTEQLVEGNQTIAPVDTPQMDAGTRTVVSGVNAADSFSYRASDHCYIISFVSLMPIVNYDIKNMHLKELRKMDIATPEFAQDSRVAIRLKDMLRGFDDNDNILGYVPRYYHYRIHGDETHGRYLNDYRSYSWFRDWYNMTFVDNANINVNYLWAMPRGFVLSPYSLRVHLTLDAFNDKLPWDDIAFGSCDIQFFKNSPLPATVDII